MSPAAVAQVTDLHSYVFIDLRASLMLLHLLFIIRNLLLFPFIFLLLSRKSYFCLNLLLLNEVLLNFSAEISLEYILIFLCIRVIAHIWQ